MEAPGALEVTRFHSVIVPVCAVKGVSAPPCVDETPGTSETPCVVSRYVFTSVAKCVLQRTHSGSARACVRVTPCVAATPGMSETPCMEETPCVSGVVWLRVCRGACFPAPHV